MTGVLLVGLLLTTTMLVTVMLPVLLTLPEKVSKKPGGTGFRHVLVTVMLAAVISVQLVVDAVFATGSCVQLSLPMTVTMPLTEQALVGAVLVTVKGADAWTDRLPTGNTVPDWPATTITGFKMTLPEFVTVPV